MTPMQTIVLVFAAALLAVAGLAVTVHYRWLSYEVALWIAMFVVFMSWRAVQPALRQREGERRKPR